MIYTPTPAKLIRRVRVDSARGIQIEEPPTPSTFWIDLTTPRSWVDNPDAPPRSLPHYQVRWREGLYGPPGGVPGGSSRIIVGTTAYELTGSPRKLVMGVRTAGWECRAAKVDDLYPLRGNLTSQAGAVLVVDLPFALWAAAEIHAGTGEYEDYDGEVPVEFFEQVGRNTHIVVGDETYRITSTALATLVPRVEFRARRAERS